MPYLLIPSRAAVLCATTLAALSAVLLLLGLPLAQVGALCGGLLVLGGAWAALDVWRSLRAWRHSGVRVERSLPQAFALGVPCVLTLEVVNDSARDWHMAVFDGVDAHLRFEGLPQTLAVPARSRVALRYRVTPVQRGPVQLGQTMVRWRSVGRCFEVQQTLGDVRTLHVYPNFAALTRYAWLAGDRRLAQIGIKTYAQRGMGTDFKQLADYQRGDAIRSIDWKASLRQGKPIVRQYQDERDQCIFFLLDCGRRMRADDSVQSQTHEVGGSHFDQALNALMLLSYVALKEGDEVGAMTFGNPDGQQRHFAPRKGTAALNALMSSLYDLEPSATHSDYLRAAQDLLRVHRKRALVIVLTNFRDEGASELVPALQLLRQRHLVLVASLRERVLRDMAQQPLVHADHVVEVATAHWMAQSRHDAFRHTMGRDALSVDVEPADLAVALVNRYHAVKRAGML